MLISIFYYFLCQEWKIKYIGCAYFGWRIKYGHNIIFLIQWTHQINLLIKNRITFLLIFLEEQMMRFESDVEIKTLQYHWLILQKDVLTYMFTEFGLLHSIKPSKFSHEMIIIDWEKIWRVSHRNNTLHSQSLFYEAIRKL